MTLNKLHNIEALIYYLFLVIYYLDLSIIPPGADELRIELYILLKLTAVSTSQSI